jgi:hypothetical protein
LSRAWVLRTCCVAGLLVASALGLPQHSSSQPSKQDYALIYGTVWGPDDYPVPGVHINIRRASDKKPKWQLVSNERGEFLQRVPVGSQDYIVEADVKVPKGEPKPQTTVHIDDNERRNMSLHLTKEELPRH